MKNWLKKLDEQAGRWLNTMDNQLQEPIVRAMTGEVFVDGTVNTRSDHDTQPVQSPTQHDEEAVANSSPEKRRDDSGTLHRPVLQQAGAK